MCTSLPFASRQGRTDMSRTWRDGRVCLMRHGLVVRVSPYREHYSGLMPANLITLAHFSVSSPMNLPKSAGKPASTVPPPSTRCVLRLGSERPALISWLSLIYANKFLGAVFDGSAVNLTFGSLRLHLEKTALRVSNPQCRSPIASARPEGAMASNNKTLAHNHKSPAQQGATKSAQSLKEMRCPCRRRLLVSRLATACAVRRVCSVAVR